jgi:hypothetical protein
MKLFTLLRGYLEQNVGPCSFIMWLTTQNNVSVAEDDEMCLLRSVAQITLQYEKGSKVYTK